MRIPNAAAPPALRPNRRKRIVALLDVGCSPSTISRTVARDREFADDIALAETNLEAKLLENIRKAASAECHWHAAGWLLERNFPNEYAPRPPPRYTADQIIQFFVAKGRSSGQTLATGLKLTRIGGAKSSVDELLLCCKPRIRR